MVPPAFPKVWQLTLQRVLHHLEPDAENVQEKHIPENESLQVGEEGEDPRIKEMISHIPENIESLQVGRWVGRWVGWEGGGRGGERDLGKKMKAYMCVWKGKTLGLKERRSYIGGLAHLDIPPDEVTWNKHIHFVHQISKGTIWVIRCVQATVFSIRPLWQRLAQVWVVQLQKLPIVILSLGGESE